MTNKELRKSSWDVVKKNGYFSIIVFFFMAIIIASLVFVNLLFDDLFLIVVPLVVLPICFAFQRAIIILRENDTLSFSLIFSGFSQYFSERFSSTYSFFNSLWKLILIYLGVGFITFITVNLSFYNTNFLGMKDIIDEISSTQLTIEALDSLYEQHLDFFVSYRMALSLPCLFALSISALFFFSKNSISFFLRATPIKLSGRDISYLHLQMIKYHKGLFYKRYFALNWPLFILFIGGFALGGYVGSLYYYNSNSIFTFGLAFALVISFAIFGFKYFANKEAIYLSLVEQYKFTEELLNKKRQQELERIKRQQEQYQKMLDELNRQRREKYGDDYEDTNDL
ncbi:MAG: hypothetical protein K5925_01505 [Bacilli bacterium]|nr:hypothetical protein [Bacilli bacterium]